MVNDDSGAIDHTPSGQLDRVIPMDAPAAAATKVQLYQTTLHVLVIVCIVLCTTALAWQHDVRESAVVGVFGTALGFAGGAASQRQGARAHDPNSSRGMDG